MAYIGNLYNPSKNLISRHIMVLGKYLDNFYLNYDNVLLQGDFNSEVSETILKEFCEIYNLKNLVKGHTCFKNLENPSCFDLVITNRVKSFQKTYNRNGLIRFPHDDSNSFKVTLRKKQPSIIHIETTKVFRIKIL